MTVLMKTLVSVCSLWNSITHVPLYPCVVTTPSSFSKSFLTHEEIYSINTTAFSSCMIGVSSSADCSWVWRRSFVFNITLRFHIPDISSQPGALDRQETRFKSSLRVKRDCFFNTAVRIIVTIENKYFRNRCGWNKRSCESALSCLPWGLAARSHAC